MLPLCCSSNDSCRGLFTNWSLVLVTLRFCGIGRLRLTSLMLFLSWYITHVLRSWLSSSTHAATTTTTTTTATATTSSFLSEVHHARVLDPQVLPSHRVPGTEDPQWFLAYLLSSCATCASRSGMTFSAYCSPLAPRRVHLVQG